MGRDAPLDSPWADLLCNLVDALTPVTVALAGRCMVQVTGSSVIGALPLGRMQGLGCEPPAPDLGT